MQAAQARAAGIQLYAVAVGTDTDRGEINDIASDPDASYVIEVPNPGAVREQASILLDRLCNN